MEPSGHLARPACLEALVESVRKLLEAQSVLSQTVEVVLFEAEWDILLRTKVLRLLQFDVLANLVDADECRRRRIGKLFSLSLCFFSPA